VSELAVRAVADQYTGRGPSTALSEMLCEHLGAESVAALSNASAGRIADPAAGGSNPHPDRARCDGVWRPRGASSGTDRAGARRGCGSHGPVSACATSSSTWCARGTCSGRTTTCWTSSAGGARAAPGAHGAARDPCGGAA
jgi:hypothetical protein